MKKSILVLICSVLFIQSNAQVLNSHTETFKAICDKYKASQFSENNCQAIITELSTLESKVGESIFFDKTITADEKTALKNIKKEITAVQHFIGYQQACLQEYFTHEELQLACTILGATNEEVFTGKYCMKIIKTNLNGYICYLAENTLNEHRKFNFKFKRNPYGVGQGASEIQAKGIKDLYNNKSEKEITAIELMYFNCQ